MYAYETRVYQPNYWQLEEAVMCLPGRSSPVAVQQPGMRGGRKMRGEDEESCEAAHAIEKGGGEVWFG